jgi:hypothetical protein
MQGCLAATHIWPSGSPSAHASESNGKDSLTRKDGRLLENGWKMASARFPRGSRKGEIVNL